jgi:hypothetical protein
MMNDVDKSIDSFDLALRRRFSWVRMDCDYDVIVLKLSEKFKYDELLEYRDYCEKLNEFISGEMKQQASITMDELLQTIQSVLVNELQDPTFIREFSGYAKTCGITQMYKLYETEDGEDRFISIDIGGCKLDGYKNFLRLYTDYDNDGSRWVTIYLHLTCLNSFKDKAADILHINNTMNDIAIISSSLSKFGLHDGVYEQFILKLYHAIKNKMQQKYDENSHQIMNEETDESKNTLRMVYVKLRSTTLIKMHSFLVMCI